MSDPTLGIELGDVIKATDQSEIKVRPETWTATKYPAIRCLGSEWPSRIVRSELADRAAGLDWDDDRELLRLFVLTMMWGSGTANGRGPRNTEAALGSGDAAGVLREVRVLLAEGDGDIAEAYGLHRRLAGVGSAFHTKWMWVVGSTVDVAPKPLILDSLVWATLGSLGWDSRRAAGSRRWAERYVAYLRACEQWADRAGKGFTAEDVEFTLFDRAKRAR